MDKRSMVISVLEDMGYQPRVDSDGDVLFRFQMKHLYVLATQQEETPFPRGHAAAVLRDEAKARRSRSSPSATNSRGR